MSKVFVNFSFIRFFRSRSWFCLGFFGRPFIQGKSFCNVWCRNAQECHSCDEHELFFCFHVSLTLSCERFKNFKKTRILFERSFHELMTYGIFFAVYLLDSNEQPYYRRSDDLAMNFPFFSSNSGKLKLSNDQTELEI